MTKTEEIIIKCRDKNEQAKRRKILKENKAKRKSNPKRKKEPDV